MCPWQKRQSLISPAAGAGEMCDKDVSFYKASFLHFAADGHLFKTEVVPDYLHATGVQAAWSAGFVQGRNRNIGEQ